MTPLDSPKVSVIITTYNRATLLPRAVDSVLAQTYSDYEVIIVDDCSSDNTQEVIAGFHDPRIRSFRHETNMKQSTAINTGIANARGEYFALLDDDDEWLPFKLEEQAAVLDEAPCKVGLVYGWRVRINDSNGNVTPHRKHTMEGNLYEYLLALNYLAGNLDIMVKLHAAREVGGFNEEVTVGNDRNFMVRIARRYHIAVVPKVLAKNHYGHGHVRISDTGWVDSSDRTRYIKAHIADFAEDLNDRPRLFALMLRRLSINEMLCRNRRAALSAFALAVKLTPLSQANLTNAPLLIKAFLWYATPLSHYRIQIRAILVKMRLRK